MSDSISQDQLRHELTALRTLIESRLDSMDRAVLVLAESSALLLDNIRRDLLHMTELYDEKLATVRAAQSGEVARPKPGER